MMDTETRIRVEKEKNELGVRIDTLHTFINFNPRWDNVSPAHQNLLRIQFDAMRTYYSILDIRLAWRE